MTVEIELTQGYGGPRRKLNTQALEVGDRVCILDEGGYHSRGGDHPDGGAPHRHADRHD
jgi:hypothetical protein